MSPVEPHGDGDNVVEDNDVMEFDDAEEDDKDNQNDEDMEVDDDEDDESDGDDDNNEGGNGHGVEKGKGKDNGIIKKSKAVEAIAEEPPAATTAMIDERVVYFYRRSDPSRKLYQLPLEKADTWMALRRYLGPLVSQTGRFKIYGPDDKQIFEVYWKPYRKVGKTFSFSYSELVFATVMSTNSTAPVYSVFTMTITERTLVHELRSLVQWEMRKQMWRTPEKANDLELDVFLIVNDRPCIARMKPHHLISNYLQGKSEQMKIKVRNMEVKREGDMTWPVWNETMYWG